MQIMQFNHVSSILSINLGKPQFFFKLLERAGFHGHSGRGGGGKTLIARTLKKLLFCSFPTVWWNQIGPVASHEPILKSRFLRWKKMFLQNLKFSYYGHKWCLMRVETFSSGTDQIESHCTSMNGASTHIQVYFSIILIIKNACQFNISFMSTQRWYLLVHRDCNFDCVLSSRSISIKYRDFN